MENNTVKMEEFNIKIVFDLIKAGCIDGNLEMIEPTIF